MKKTFNKFVYMQGLIQYGLKHGFIEKTKDNELKFVGNKNQNKKLN